MSLKAPYVCYILSLSNQINIEYGLIVWGRAMPRTLKPVQTNIKKTIRKMLFKKSNYSKETLFQKLNILNFEKLKLLKIEIFMWTVLNGHSITNIKRPLLN